MTEPVDVALAGLGGSLAGRATIETLAAEDPHACNTFEKPDAVRPVSMERDFADGDRITLPAASVTAVRVAQ